MNPVVQRVAVSALTAALRKLGGALVASPPAGMAGLSSDHATALGKLLSLLPVFDIINIVENGATVDSALTLGERLADVVKVAFPPAAMTAIEVKLGLEALQFVLDLAGVGGNKIEGGMPSGWTPGGGPGLRRGQV